MLDAHHIAALQHQATHRWHSVSVAEPWIENTLARLVLEQHRANFDLWHREDEARDPQADDAVIASVKHAIDTLNQRRNDLVELIDQTLFAELVQKADSTLHSETPGLIVDRLSILSLKIFHTEAQIARDDVDEAHRERNRKRLLLLQEQRRDLTDCLEELWDAVQAGRRRFKLYRQLKMYNDPTLNPVLYRAHKLESSASKDGGDGKHRGH